MTGPKFKEHKFVLNINMIFFSFHLFHRLGLSAHPPAHQKTPWSSRAAAPSSERSGRASYRPAPGRTLCPGWTPNRRAAASSPWATKLRAQKDKTRSPHDCFSWLHPRRRRTKRRRRARASLLRMQVNTLNSHTHTHTNSIAVMIMNWLN